MNITLKQLEMRQVHSTKSLFEYNKDKKEIILTFYRPWKAGLPTVSTIQIYTRQQLEENYEIDQTYKYDCLVDIKEVYRYDERFDFPRQLCLSDIVDHSYYEIIVSLKIKNEDEY